MSEITDLEHLIEQFEDDNTIANRAILELDARVKELEDIALKPQCNNYSPLNDAKPTPTDEELVDKLISEYLFLFNARFDLDVKDSEDVRDILRQLIRKDRIVL